MSQTLRREKLWTILPDVIRLAADHAAEVGQRDLVPSVDWSRYLALENTGHLIALTLRKESLALAGYALIIVGRHMHYDAIVGHVKAVYIAPTHRALWARALVRRAEYEAAAAGAIKLGWHAKRSNRFGQMLAALGYEEPETFHMKTLEPGDGLRVR